MVQHFLGLSLQALGVPASFGIPLVGWGGVPLRVGNTAIFSMLKGACKTQNTTPPHNYGTFWDSPQGTPRSGQAPTVLEMWNCSPTNLLLSINVSKGCSQKSATNYWVKQMRKKKQLPNNLPFKYSIIQLLEILQVTFHWTKCIKRLHVSSAPDSEALTQWSGLI